jgi:hypothetical protein
LAVEKEGVVVMWMAVAQGPGLALGLARVVRVVVLAHAVEAAVEVVGVASLVEPEMVEEQARAQALARIVMELVVAALLAQLVLAVVLAKEKPEAVMDPVGTDTVVALAPALAGLLTSLVDQL